MVVTYKIPDRKVMLSPIFFEVSSCRLKMMGIGRRKMMASANTDTKPDMTPVSVLS